MSGLRLALLLACLAGQALPAGEASIRIELVSDELAVGEECEIVVDYRYPASATLLQAPAPERAFAGLHLLSAVREVNRELDGQRHERWRLRCLVPQSGAWALPQPSLVLAGEPEPQRIEAEPLIVQVGVDADEPALPEALALWQRPPPAAREADIRGLWFGLAAGVVVLVASGLWWFLRPSRVVDLDPYRALQNELPRALQTEDGKQAAAIISGGLRRYLGGRFGFDGVGATYEETMRHLPESLPTALRQDLRQFFRSLDDLRWSPRQLQAAVVQPFVDRAGELAAAFEAELQRQAAAEAAARRV